jgi:uncharacterized protein
VRKRFKGWSSGQDVTARESRIAGLGVFAERPFAAGDVVLVIDTSRVVDDERPLRPEAGEHEEHCTYLRDGRVVLLQAPERHLNHSCDPNAYLRTVGTGLHVVARRPIESGQEVTLDYLINTHGGTRWRCHCEADRCRGLLEQSFFDLPLELQQEYLPLLEDWFAQQHSEAVARLESRLR